MTTDTLDVRIALADPPAPSERDGALRVTLATDAERPAPTATASLHRPVVVRDALLALGDVLGSDLRYRGRDRADYLAYLVQKGKGVSKQVWDAQKEWLALRYGEAARAEEPLEPALTVAADGLRFEVMSRDESAYAQLALRSAALGDPRLAAGTTFVDLSPAALRAAGRVRSYRKTELAFAPSATTARTRQVPLRWLRAFGQMQAATLLPAERFALAPIDLYNVLVTLRLRKAKQAPRALRYELVPGAPPRIVLEPWDLVLASAAAPYTGARPRVVRTWGRNRLLTLARILPHARGLHVHLLGPGLPALYVVDLGDATFTLALSGWTDAGWAGVATFDRLAAHPSPAAESVRVALARAPMSEAELVAATGASPRDVRTALLAELAQLRVGHDVAAARFFARPLLATPIAPERLQYRDAREAHAHRLLAEPGQVTLTKVHDQGGDGQTIEGSVDDGLAHRRFHASFTIDREGGTAAASCTCPAFRRAGIKEGPCEHMIAVRVLYAREQARLEAARDTTEGRALIRSETRTLLRRRGEGAAEHCRLSLDDRHLVSRFGRGAEDAQRVQRLVFPTADEARAAYFARLEELGEKGYVDAGA